MEREYFLIGVRDNLYAIQDSSDNSIDIVTYTQMISLLTLGFQIKGVDSPPPNELRQMPNPTFSYKDTYFPVEEYTDEGEYDEEEELLFDDYDDVVDDEEAPDDTEEDLYEDYADDVVEEEGEYQAEDDDYDPYFDLDEENADSAYTRLYNYLSPEQAKVLRSYILWRAREVFKVADASDKFIFSNSRNEAKLQKYREGGEYYYAGMVDTGRTGNGRCTLGHELRYVHIAVDMTQFDCDIDTLLDKYNYDFDALLNLPNTLVFGRTCVTEFFKVGEDSIDALGRAQTESLCDLKELCEIYERGIAEQIRGEFGVLDDVMKAVSSKALFSKDDDSGLVRKGHIYFYKKFIEAGMPYPRSLVLGIRDDLVHWHSHKFLYKNYQSIRSSYLEEAYRYVYPTVVRALLLVNEQLSGSMSIFGGFPAEYAYHVRDSFFHMRAYLEFYMRCKICGRYVYKYDGNSLDSAEGGKSKPMREHWDAFTRCADSFFKSEEDKYSSKFLKRFDGYIMQSLKFKDELDAYAKTLSVYELCDNGISYSEKHFEGMEDLLDFVKREKSSSSDYSTDEFYSLGVRRGLFFNTRSHYSFGNKLGMFEFGDTIVESMDALIEDINSFKSGTLQGAVEKLIADKNQYVLSRIETRKQADLERQKKLAETEQKVFNIVNKPAGTVMVVEGRKCETTDIVNIVKYLFKDEDLVEKLKNESLRSYQLSKSAVESGTYESYNVSWLMSACNIMTDLVFVDTRTKATLDKVDFILANAGNFGKFRKAQLVLDICQTVHQNKRVSDKQLYYIDLGLEKLKEKGYVYGQVQP